MRIVRALIIVLVGFVLVPEIEAQNERRDSRAISMIKRFKVSQLDKQLKAVSFSNWIGQVLGKSQKVEWEVNDCGEQDGSGRQKDFPICVQASTTTTASIEVSVMIAVGTHKRGIIGKPAVWGVWVGRKGETASVFDNLSDLAPELKRLSK